MINTCRVCGQQFEEESASITCCSTACSDAGIKAARIEERWNYCECREELRLHRKPLQVIREKNPAAWAFADAWDRTQNVYAVGPEGVGKSALCKYLLTRDVERGKVVRIASLLRIESAGYSDRHVDYIYGMREASTLLLDDLHCVEWTPKGLAVLRSIIDWRHESGRRTLVTCNEVIAAVVARFDCVMSPGWGSQTMRRLAPVEVLVMGGESYRIEMQRAATRKEAQP